MKAARAQPWLAPAAFAAARLALAPKTYNTHALMYPVVAEVAGRNALELFHPLYVPLLKVLNFFRHLAGFSGPSMHLYQALSLAGALLHLRLIYALAEIYCKDKKTALCAALLATTSINLWAWSLQTMPYTLATSASLGCLLLLLRGESPWKVGALTGLAMGFDTAGLALLPVCLLEIGPGRKKIGYLTSAAATLAACYVPFLLIGREIPANASAFMTLLPFDIVSLARSKSVAAQAREWLASTAPSDASWLLFAALFAWGALGLKRGRLPLAFFAAVSAFFFAADPHNRFIWAGALLWPVVAAALSERFHRAAPACAILGLALLAKNFAWPADYVPKANLTFDEAAFVGEKLGPDGLLVSVSEPDMIFSYAYQGRGEVLRPSDPPFSDTRQYILSCLAKGHPVWLAADSLFRDSRVPKEAMDAQISLIVENFKKDLVLEEPVVSPNGQYFYPLAKKR